MNKKNQVRRIFDSIAYRYDLLNHLLSFGIDIYWRKKAIRLSGMNENSILLDIACGTGDFAITAKKSGVNNIFGADFSYNMLTLFKKKSDWIKGKTTQLEAENLPFKNESVTNITVAFGVRNFYDIQKAFISFRRVLKEKGKVTVLEFRMPEKGFYRMMYIFYFKNVLPFVGRIISGDKEAYTYLPESVEEFDKKINLVELFNNAGFRKVEKYSMTFGTVQVIIAEK